jgi:hypothetical protein
MRPCTKETITIQIFTGEKRKYARLSLHSNHVGLAYFGFPNKPCVRCHLMRNPN